MLVKKVSVHYDVPANMVRTMFRIDGGIVTHKPIPLKIDEINETEGASSELPYTVKHLDFTGSITLPMEFFGDKSIGEIRYTLDTMFKGGYYSQANRFPEKKDVDYFVNEALVGLVEEGVLTQKNLTQKKTLSSAPHYTSSSKGRIPSLAKACPALESMVRYPCECFTKAWIKANYPPKARLQDVIIHLNDRHRWTREAIADWIESLDVNTEIKELT